MIKRRINSNPEKSFEDACAENNIVLTERKGNLESMYIIDDFGNVEVCDSVEYKQSLKRRLKRQALELSRLHKTSKVGISYDLEARVVPEVRVYHQSNRRDFMELTMCKSAERKHVKKGIIRKWVMHISNFIQGIKN